MRCHASRPRSLPTPLVLPYSLRFYRSSPASVLHKWKHDFSSLVLHAFCCPGANPHPSKPYYAVHVLARHTKNAFALQQIVQQGNATASHCTCACDTTPPAITQHEAALIFPASRDPFSPFAPHTISPFAPPDACAAKLPFVSFSFHFALLKGLTSALVLL